MAEWHLNPEDCSLCLDGRTVVLTEREFEVLVYMVARAGEVVLRADLEREVWGFRSGVRSKVVPVTIGRLRKKLESRGFETIRGKGWRFTPPVQTPVHPEVSKPAVSADRQDVFDALNLAVERGATLITLTGPVGVGKSHTAFAWVESLALRHQVVSCDLSRITTIEAAGLELARVLEVQLSAGPVVDAVARELSTRENTLVLLDGFEGVANLTPSLVQLWHSALPSDSLLVLTSRQRLQHPDGITVPVDPLPTPAAVELFVRFARSWAIGSTPETVSWAYWWSVWTACPKRSSLQRIGSPSSPSLRSRRGWISASSCFGCRVLGWHRSMSAFVGRGSCWIPTTPRCSKRSRSSMGPSRWKKWRRSVLRMGPGSWIACRFCGEFAGAGQVSGGLLLAEECSGLRSRAPRTGESTS